MYNKRDIINRSVVKLSDEANNAQYAEVVGKLGRLKSVHHY